MSSQSFQIDRLDKAQRILDRCRLLATYTEVEGETTRTFLSEPMRGVHGLVGEWMRGAGMAVSVDAAGNIRGLKGVGPRLLIASHLDTVPNAGAFDGILGVMLGIAVVEECGDAPVALEVIGFSEEEGVRFRKPFLGSMALTGELEEHLGLVDAAGVTVAEAMGQFGCDVGRLREARLAAETVGYLEFHIEQGPVLESMDLPLGVVSALVGQTRCEFKFVGHGNHAGTTPMRLRRDALTAAAEWILRVEELALATDGLVATVGRIEAQPGAGNVIPGTVTVSLDVRHTVDGVRRAAVEELTAAAEEICGARRIRVERKILMEQGAVALDAGLTERLAAVAGGAAARLTSGAGHDAMVLAPHVPSVMLFLRSPGGGVSHHPDENVLVEDVAAALRVGVAFVRGLG